MTTENIQQGVQAAPLPIEVRRQDPPGKDGGANQTGAVAAAATSERQLVTFLLNGEEFGFDIMDVQEIIRPPKIARMPRTPGYVDGVANLRGMVLPIIDTRERFGLPRVEDTDRSRVLVIDNQGEKTGLRVDRVRQVTRVSSGDIEPPPAAIRGRSADYLSGVVKLEQGKRIIMALDPAKVCQVEAKQARAGAAAGVAAAAQAQAGRDERQQVEVEQLVTFKLGREEFGFQIEHVREILRVEDPKELPDSPDYILGVLTVRGQILTIVDLRCLLQQRSLAEDICAQLEVLREAFSTGLPAARATLAGKDGQAPGLAFLSAAKEWFNGFKTSSQELMEQVSRLRAANDEALRQAQSAAALRQGAPEESRVLYEQEVLRLALLVQEGFTPLEQAVRKSTREDQRIVVVDVGGLLVGLVVDQVKEVVNVAKTVIDPPPQMAGNGSLQLSGIARLSDGARLILLLDASRLLETGSLQELKQQAGGDVTSGSGAERKAAAQGSGSVQLVTFRLGDEEFGVPISQIQEIDRHSKITRMPRAPAFVEGITNLRGEVIPVIDARKRFGLPAKEADDRTRTIIIDLGGTKTGLLVDSVSQVLNLSRADIAPPPSAIASGEENGFISGIGKVDAGKRMVVLLDMEKILSSKEQIAIAQVAKAAAGGDAR